jgi:hypothetical protein
MIAQVGRQCRQARQVSVGKTYDHLDVRSVRPAQTLTQRPDAGVDGCGLAGMQDPDLAISPCLLRARRKRPKERRRRRAAEQRDDLAAFHSITSSARASSVGGISRPSALAVLRLIISSTFVDC